MTAKDFRKIALSLPEAEKRSHMEHPDFRVAGKIFATLGYPDKSRGMVKLSPEDQHNFSKDYPDAFVPVKGVWGKRGATSVHLKATKKEVARKAIEAAWRNTAPSRVLREHDDVSRGLTAKRRKGVNSESLCLCPLSGHEKLPSFARLDSRGRPSLHVPASETPN
jgi:hypothetical protein